MQNRGVTLSYRSIVQTDTRLGAAVIAAFTLAVLSATGTLAVMVVFLTGRRYEFIPMWMLGCIFAQVLAVPGILIGAVGADKATRGWILPSLANVVAVAAALIGWTLFAIL